MTKIVGQIKISGQKIKKLEALINNLLEFKKAIEESLRLREETTPFLEICVGGAIILKSSDIHIEKKEKEAKMRIRMDGILHDVYFFEFKIYKSLLSRIKLLSGIKLNIADRAQDGRFTVFWDKLAIEMRVSTLPSEYGESIVIRILNPQSLIEIEELGIRKDIFEVLKKEIQKPNGMIIVTGPTGCGKTTTLYAILKRITSPEIKIITLEDPIEYHLEGISQTQVNPKKGYDFANGLRAILRQDPDVILVGEIRDLETATIALQAALTGHLVLTTLHTNDAAGAIARLQALGEKPINIAPALNIAIGQRLIRKVCQKCIQFSSPTKEEFSFFKKELYNLPKEIKLPSSWEIIRQKTKTSKSSSLFQNLKIPRAKGCEACNQTGFKGRIGIYEFFLIDSEMENLILNSPPISILRKKAKDKGMIYMRQDGLIKILEGQTALEEVERVT